MSRGQIATVLMVAATFTYLIVMDKLVIQKRAMSHNKGLATLMPGVFVILIVYVFALGMRPVYTTIVLCLTLGAAALNFLALTLIGGSRQSIGSRQQGLSASVHVTEREVERRKGVKAIAGFLLLAGLQGFIALLRLGLNDAFGSVIWLVGATLMTAVAGALAVRLIMRRDS